MAAPRRKSPLPVDLRALVVAPGAAAFESTTRAVTNLPNDSIITSAIPRVGSHGAITCAGRQGRGG